MVYSVHRCILPKKPALQRWLFQLLILVGKVHHVSQEISDPQLLSITREEIELTCTMTGFRRRFLVHHIGEGFFRSAELEPS
jgi:hypothetical protein